MRFPRPARAYRIGVLLRMDNGPEMTANALRDWCRFSGAERSFIEPGLPVAEPVRGVFRLPRPRRGALGRGVRLGDRGANGHK
jgi:transposase InsO family protein